MEMQFTKIVATLGPASSSPEVVRDLIAAGVDVFRFNFSHGTHESHAQLLATVRDQIKASDSPVALLADLSGPKIRVGKFKDGKVDLAVGQKFSLFLDPNRAGDETGVGTTYSHLVDDVRVGDTVLLDDGNISMRAVSKAADHVCFEVTDGGPLKDKKGMNMPGIPLSVAAVTEKDKADLEFILANGFDFVALSFVRSARDLVLLRELIGARPIRVVTKVEKPEALEDLPAVLAASDAVMVARGDLGVEVPLQCVPALQKHIIRECQRRNIPVITATQMLESMITNERPTRAETTDVFNAIIDGTDAIMLSAETAAGQYPIHAVKTMVAIAREAEKCRFANTTGFERQSAEDPTVEDTIAHVAAQSALELDAKAIVCFTQSGTTAKRISRYRPTTPVLALTPKETTQRRLCLAWGVQPVKTPDMDNTDVMIKEAERQVLALGWARPGDVIVIAAGVPLGVPGNTNLLKLHRISA